MSDRKYPPRSVVKQTLLKNQEFLNSLSTLLSSNTGSIHLTQKRLDTTKHESGIIAQVTETIDSVMKDVQVADDDYEVLFRATNGKDQKISTRVKSYEASSFMEKYGEVCRIGMGPGMKKRDRKKIKKTAK